MITRSVTFALLTSIILVLSGCAAKTVRCDSKLTPINAPAPRTLHMETPGAGR